MMLIAVLIGLLAAGLGLVFGLYLAKNYKKSSN
jgi:hypothetical protein